MTVRRPPGPGRGSDGRSWRDAEFLALDFETTGLNLARDAIVSLGAIPVRGGRAILGESIYQEVRPPIPPSPRSIKVHHLRAGDLATAPPLAEAALGLSEALAGRYLLAWVAEVEIGFLRQVFGGPRRWWRRRTVDVWALARLDAHLSGLAVPPGQRGLAATVARHGIPVEEAHRALDDALMTAELFLVLATRLDRRLRTVRRLIRASR